MKFIENKTFKDLTTFRIGGKIKYFVEIKNVDEIKEATRFATKNDLQVFIMGAGSDILVGDKDFDGLVIKYVGKSVRTQKIRSPKFLVTAEAGMVWDGLVKYCVAKELQGIECLSGIPGTVGAAPIQNIGAYGQDLKDVFVNLRAYDIFKRKLVEFSKEDCRFSYRESIFKDKKYWQKFLITDVTLRLKKGSKPRIKYDSLQNYLMEKGIKNPSLGVVRKEVLAIRKGKFENPNEAGNAGSFFKNPIIKRKQATRLLKVYPQIPLLVVRDGIYKGSAGWFIEKAGWKGNTFKGAGVSLRHALILINVNGRASASDVVELSERIIKDVFKKFDIRLEREVQLINI